MYKYENKNDEDEEDEKYKLNIIEEEPWNDRIEQYIWDKQKEAKEKSKQQHEKGNKNKNMYYIFAIPPILIQATMTFVLPFVKNNDWVPQLAFMITTILTSIAAFMNYGEKYGINYSFEKDYETIVSMIHQKMSSSRKFRGPADIFTTEIRLRMEFLNHEAPNVDSNSNSKFKSLYNYYKNLDL